jgi:hypothetical protein
MCTGGSPGGINFYGTSHDARRGHTLSFRRCRTSYASAALTSSSSPTVAEKRTFRTLYFVYHTGKVRPAHGLVSCERSFSRHFGE